MLRALLFVSMSFGDKVVLLGRGSDFDEMYDKAGRALPWRDLFAQASAAYVEYIEADWRAAYPGIMA